MKVLLVCDDPLKSGRCFSTSWSCFKSTSRVRHNFLAKRTLAACRIVMNFLRVLKKDYETLRAMSSSRDTLSKEAKHFSGFLLFQNYCRKLRYSANPSVKRYKRDENQKSSREERESVASRHAMIEEQLLSRLGKHRAGLYPEDKRLAYFSYFHYIDTCLCQYCKLDSQSGVLHKYCNQATLRR